MKSALSNEVMEGTQCCMEEVLVFGGKTQTFAPKKKVNKMFARFIDFLYSKGVLNPIDKVYGEVL